MKAGNFKRFIGSTIALVFGMSSLLFGLTNPRVLNAQVTDLTFTGIIIILGALAYRSAKQRKLGLVKPSKIRQILEIGAILIIIFGTLLQKDLKYLILTNAYQNVLTPLWAVIAYLVISIKKMKKEQV